ncbi:hypothetical protein ACO0QE_001226 [Hanseniaspora vineae]
MSNKGQADNGVQRTHATGEPILMSQQQHNTYAPSMKQTQHKPTKYKKKLSLEGKVNKIANKFIQDKDFHYKERLTRLQTNLTTMHQGNNVEFLRKVRDLEEERDMNLVGLRYFEEYRVSRSSVEFDQDIEQLKKEHENLVTLCKKKLFEQIEYKIKMLQEEKLLIEVANSHAYSMDYSNIYNQQSQQHGMVTRNNRHLTRGESLRLGGDQGSDSNATHSSSFAGLFNSNGGYSSTERTGSPWLNESGSSADDLAKDSSANVFIGSRRSLRRRVTTKQAERMSKEQELESINENATGSYGRAGGQHKFGNKTSGNGNGKGSGSNNTNNNSNDPELSAEWVKLVSGYSQLHALLFGNTDEDGKNDYYNGSYTHSAGNAKKRNVGRHSTKSAPPLPSLEKDEVTDDINLIRSLTGQDPSPFASSNSELEDVLKTMESLELKFNQWFQYPYVFLNDEPFTQEFKDAVQQHTLSKVEFGVIPSDNWDFPEHLESKTSDQKSSKNVQFESNFEDQEDRGILYGGMKSYHKMCRFYSGFFYKHPLVQQYEWYWRIEPDVRFFCTTTYDPFYEMQKHKKRYGLFKHTQAFLKNYKKNVDSSFEVGTLWPMFVDSYKQYDGDADQKFGDTKVLDIFVNRQEEVDEELSRYVEKEYYLKNYEPDASQVQERIKEHGIGSIIRQGFIKPEIFEDKFDKQEYNLCHFWSNFEISRVDTFDNPIYNAYFQYLDNLGGFYQERWGDAVVHTLGVAMLNREDIHYFRDMGYQHSTLAHCPKNLANGQLDNPNDKNFESTCLPFYKTYGQHTSKNTANSWKTRIQDTLSTVFLQEEPSATAYGSGCQCECPFLKDDIEDASSFCSSKFFEHMSDDYRPERKPKLNSLMNKVYQSYERYIQE